MWSFRNPNLVMLPPCLKLSRLSILLSIENKMSSITEKVLIVNPDPSLQHCPTWCFPANVPTLNLESSSPVPSYFIPLSKITNQKLLPPTRKISLFIYFYKPSVSPMYHTSKNTVPLSVIRWPTSVSPQLDYKFHEGRNCTGYDCSLPSAKVKCLTHTRNVKNTWGNE